MRWLVSLTGLAVLATAQADELPPTIERVLTGHGIPPDDVSMFVTDVASGEPMLSHLPDTPRNPASVMKLVTTWAALEILGPAFTWQTDVYFGGKFDGTVLAGPRYAAVYQIHKTRCIFCGMCEEACPVSAIFMGKDYELAVYSKDDFIWDKADLLVAPPDGAKPPVQQAH